MPSEEAAKRYERQALWDSCSIQKNFGRSFRQRHPFPGKGAYQTELENPPFENPPFAVKTEFLFCVTARLEIFYKQEIAEKEYYRSNPIFFSALHNNILTNREVAYKIVNVKGVIRRTYGGLFYN